MENAGCDMSLCVAAVVDSKAMLWVEEHFETPAVSQFACDVSDDFMETPTEPACVPSSGETLLAAEMFVVSPSPAPVVPPYVCAGCYWKQSRIRLGNDACPVRDEPRTVSRGLANRG